MQPFVCPECGKEFPEKPVFCPDCETVFRKVLRKDVIYPLVLTVIMAIFMVFLFGFWL